MLTIKNINDIPLVSICCITYNHVSFIRQCLDGFLLQETTFPVEILIHDDASTDGTDSIIKEYAQQYPGLIFPIFEEENQYSKAGHKYVDFYNYERARGKYIAYCEGDDYWTDPLKLQRQVEFMDLNPDYSICFHDYSIYDENTHTYSYEKYSNQIELENGGCDVDFPMVIGVSSYGGKPLTMLFRKDMYCMDWARQYRYYRDTHEIYHLLRSGKGRYLNFNAAVYRRHSGGVHSSMSEADNVFIVREGLVELYRNNMEDDVLKRIVRDVLLWEFDKYSSLNMKGFSTMIVHLGLAPSLVCMIYFTVIKRKIKYLLKCCGFLQSK